MPPPPLLLIPPSEGKSGDGDRPPVDWHGGRFGYLGDQRLLVRDAVKAALRAGRGQDLLGVQGTHLTRALAEWNEIDAAPTARAGDRYSGVVWGGLDLPTLPAAARRRAMGRIVIPSGLWGLAGAADAIPPYRLKMGARVARLGLLSAWWRPAASRALAQRAGSSWVIDLLPQEHRQAIDPSALRRGRLVRVEIVEDGPSGRISVGHAGKQVKGRLARAILEYDARTADEVASVLVDGLSLVSVQRGDMVQVTFRRDA